MDVDLINAALTVMGLDPLADPARPVGRVQTAASRLHLDVRRAVLEANLWSACDKAARIEPEEDGIVPPDYTYVGLLPADFLGLWRANQTPFTLITVGDGEAARKRIAWCGDAALTIRYSADISYGLMNPLLKQACRDKLAAALAIVQTEKATDRKVHNDIAVQSEIQCASRDALNRQEAPLFRSEWDGANVGGGGYGDPSRRGSW